MSRKLFKVISILVLFSMLAVPVSAKPATAELSQGTAQTDGSDSNLQLEPVVSTQVTQVGNPTASVKGEIKGVSETGYYIVQLSDPSLARYQGGIAGLVATSPEVTGVRRLDTSTPQSQAYLSYLDAQQNALLDNMEAAFGRSIEVAFQYKNVLNAVAVRISQEEALQTINLAGVRNVFPDTLRSLETDIGPTLIGAPSIWNGDTPGDLGTFGENIIIGMIDSGINHAHPSFADVGGDGYDHTNPRGAGDYVGWCEANPSFCNDKLIGAYGLNPIGGDPEDTNGHGSHTASTAGGNFTDVEFDDGAGGTFIVTISGVAPHANLIAYKVCNPGCPGSASIAAVDLAIEDSVNVINYSISGSDDPWNDPVDLAFLDAFAAGIFVSASAGNDGPGAGTVAKTGPWNAAVAASTHSRLAAHPLDVVTDSGSLLDLGALEGSPSYLSADLTAPIIWGGDVDSNNINGCTAWTGTPFTGAIGMVQRGSCTFEIKINNLQAAGAVGALVYNNVGGPPITMGVGTAVLPAMMITLNNGLAVVDLITGDNTATATMYKVLTFVYDDDLADVMAGFSSRGPSQWDLLKPDYTAPGVNILAAVAAVGGDPVQYDFYQGTSMASPHGAGSAALMMALHPTWSPAEVKSAIASTADQTVFDSDGITPADPFDMGSGRIDLSTAAYAGLVLDETTANYMAANPYLDGQPKTLNQPSMADANCVGSCSWTRTVKSVADEALTYDASFVSTVPTLTVTVEPSSFTIDTGATQVLTFTAEVTGLPVDVFAFGEIQLTPAQVKLMDGCPGDTYNGALETTDPTFNRPIGSGASCSPSGVGTDVYYDVYTFDMASSAPHDLFASLCGGAAFDTVMVLYQAADGSPNPFNPSSSCQNSFAFNDDFCGLQSEINAVNLVEGQAQVVVTSFSNGATGDYSMATSSSSCHQQTAYATQHMPLAVMPATANLPDLVNIVTDEHTGTTTIYDVQVISDIVDLTVDVAGLGLGERHELSLNQGVIETIEVVVPNDTLRLVAEIVISEAPDVDLYVYDPDGVLACMSATGVWAEYCNLDNPAPGTWQVDVENFTGTSDPDRIVAVTALVAPVDAGNMTVTGPASVPGSDPFDLDVNWNEPSMQGGDYWYGQFAVGTEPAFPGNLGYVNVNLDFLGAKITKTGPETALLGDTIHYDITIDFGTDLSGTAVLTDMLPAGIEIITSTLTSTFGTAWYDDVDNAVYWGNSMPLLAYEPKGSPLQPDNLPLTIKEADPATAIEQEVHASLPASKLEGAVTLLEEGFEGGVMPPASWTVIDSPASRHWQLIDTGDNPAWIHSGTYAGWVNYVAEDQNEWLISPLMVLTEIQNPMAEFWVYANNNWVDYAELQFLVIDDGGTFTDTLWYQSNENWPYPSAYYQLQIDLSAYEGDSVYLAWRYVGNDGDSIALDDILVTGFTVQPTVVTISFDAVVTANQGEVTNTVDLDYNGKIFTADTTMTVLAPDIEVTAPALEMTLLPDETGTITFTIGNVGTANLVWSLAEDPEVAWLDEAPASGTTLPEGLTEVTVTFDATGQAAGEYTTTIVISSNDPDEASVTLDVTLTVTAVPAPDIEVAPLLLEKTLMVDDTGTLTLTISNVGTADLNWDLADGAAWLSEDPISGTIPAEGMAEVEVTFASAGLTPGVYTTTMDVNSDDPDEPVVTVDVELTVVAVPIPDIEVTAPALEMTLLPDETGTLTFTIGNVGTANLVWSLAENLEVAWLDEAPVSGTTLPEGLTEVTVTFDAAGLAAGDYTTTIVITSNDPDEASITLDVTLTVNEIVPSSFQIYLPIIFR